MSASDIIANMSLGWNRTPASVASGTGRNGMSAALWTHDIDDEQFVSGDADPTLDNISLVLSPLYAEVQHDSRYTIRRSVLPGEVTIVPRGVTPKALHRGSWSILHFYLPGEWLSSLAQTADLTGSALELIDPRCAADPEIYRIGQVVLDEMQAGRPLEQLRIDAIELELAVHVLRRWSSLVGTRALTKEPVRGGLAPWQERRATEHLVEHLAADTTLEQLAAAVNLSAFHFARMFKTSTGRSPLAFQRQLRCERAKHMLAATSQPIGEIAAAVGYETPQAFARMFRAEVGVSPSEYRRERRL